MAHAVHGGKTALTWNEAICWGGPISDVAAHLFMFPVIGSADLDVSAQQQQRSCPICPCQPHSVHSLGMACNGRQ